MRRTILYYPDIMLPDGPWLKKALLYWDEVSSIVPRGLEYEPEFNNYLNQYLRDNGEYRPIYPDQLMTSQYFEQFEEECIKKIRSYTTANNVSRKHGFKLKSNKHNEKTNDFYGIHRDKMSSRIMEMLYRQRLSSSTVDDSEWLIMESQLAETYMSTLAKYIALSDVNYTVIGTDRLDAINNVFPVKQTSKKPFMNKKPFFNLSLNILPVPSQDVSYEQILRFKNKYRDELLSFRNILNDFEKQVSNSESEDELKNSTIIFQEKIEKGTRDAMKMLKGAGINFFLSSLKSIINIKSPTMLAAIAGITGQKIVEFSTPAVITGVGVAGVLEISLNYMNLSKSTYEKLSDKGFLYLHYARSKKIIKDFN